MSKKIILGVLLIAVIMLLGFSYAIEDSDGGFDDYEEDPIVDREGSEEDLDEEGLDEDDSDEEVDANPASSHPDDLLDDFDDPDDDLDSSDEVQCVQCGNDCLFRNVHVKAPCAIATEDFVCEVIAGECVKIMDPEWPVCGNGFCEEGEADIYIPGGCGPNSPPGCLGKPARFIKGTCPEDCEDMEDEDRRSGDDERKIDLDIKIDLKEESEDDKTRFVSELSNGEEKEIKIMPDIASEKFLEKLGLDDSEKDNCCEVVLKEVGEKEDARVVYEISADKEGLFLGLFKIKTRVSGQIDAENGEIIKIKKPWWSFLVVGI